MERLGQAKYERPIRVSDFDFILHIRLIGPPILLTSALLPRLPAPGSSPSMQPSLPTKALKTGVRATPHSAPQPLPIVDIVAKAAKLQEAMARGP